MSRAIRIPVETDAQTAARDLESLSSTADKAGGKFDGMAGKVAGFVGGLGLASTAYAGFTAALDKEKAVDKLAASLGATPEVAARYGRISSKLYAGAWGESMDDVTASVGAVKSSFGDLSNSGGLKAVTAQALDFASIFDTEVPRAVSVASTVMKSGLAKNATEAFDLITAASQKVPADLRGDVLDAAEEYSQFFDTLGFSGEEAFSLIVKGAQKGAFGIDKIGDAVKEFTIRATDGSKSTGLALESIGIDAGKVQSKIAAGGKGARDATNQIVSGLLGIKDPAQQAQTAIALFGTPLEDLNVKDIPDFLKGLQDSGDGLGKWEGSIKSAGDTLNDNASTRIEGWKRAATTAFVDLLGNKVIPFLEKYQGILGPVGVALGVVTAAVLAYKAGVAAAAAIQAVQTAVTVTATGATAALNAVMRANPIGLVITALTLLVAGLVIAYKKSETFRDIVDGALKVVKKGFEALGAAGTWLWNNALQPAFQFIVKGIASILDLWAKMLEVLGKVPGFGWAKDAADAMSAAADKARALADGITKIPPRKEIVIHTTYTYSGLRGPGGQGPTRGRDDDFAPSSRTTIPAPTQRIVFSAEERHQLDRGRDISRDLAAYTAAGGR